MAGMVALSLMMSGVAAAAQGDAAAKPAPCVRKLHPCPKCPACPPPTVVQQQPQPQTKADPKTAQPCSAVAKDCVRIPLLSDCVYVWVLCLVAVAIVLYPILRFLTRQWMFRRDRIYGALAGDAVVHYYIQFRRGSAAMTEFPPEYAEDPDGPTFTDETQTQYMRAFQRDFVTWYGRRYYLAPVLMLAAVTFATAWWIAGVLKGWSVRSPDDTYRSLVAAALGGAFMWVISDELDRLRRRDFTTSDVYYYVFRILIAIPFAWALSKTHFGAGDTVLTVPVTIPLAFFLGAFPTTTLFTFARRIVTQVPKLNLADDKDSKQLDLEKLQSVMTSNAERFKDEAVNTITGLAYSDPIDLTIRTNFDLNYVVDCVSQALLWIYFGDDTKKLFKYSLRGAQEVAALVSWLDDPPHQASAEQAVADAAASLGMSVPAFRATLAQVAEDPYTIFLVDIWT